jgi:hypothetical protein
MKKLVITSIGMAFVTVFCLMSAAFAIHEIIPSETVIPEPGPNAEQLNEYIVKYKPYTSWNFWPGKSKLYKGSQPHGDLLTTFVNQAAWFSIRDKKGMTDGSIIAKEAYSADKKFLGLVVMYKIKGYNPQAGDWFYAKYASDGKVLASGRVDACIKCHEQKKDNDYLFTGSVK